jgi:Protein of unknown function (DUF2849)
MGLEVRNNRRQPGRSSIVTANRLRDGQVVWLAPEGRWTEDIAAAEIFDNGVIEEAIGRARIFEEQRVVLDVYGIELDSAHPCPVPVTERERIRAAGPSVRPDLGQQAKRATIHAS